MAYFVQFETPRAGANNDDDVSVSSPKDTGLDKGLRTEQEDPKRRRTRGKNFGDFLGKF